MQALQELALQELDRRPPFWKRMTFKTGIQLIKLVVTAWNLMMMNVSVLE